MPDTLESLNLAVVASPEDRTVRLVYADALDETGDPADAARAEFIRAQIEGERLPAEDFRRIAHQSRARDLFEQHWLDWWRPVCAAAGLPEPHTPGKRRRVPLPPGARRTRRPRNWPYSHTAADTTIHAAGYGLSVTFAGGFPEEVRFLNMDTPENAPELVHRWGAAMPVVRLAFTHAITPEEWARVDGPHLARLPELTFDRLPPDTTLAVAESPHLAALTRLAVHPIGGQPEAVRAVVASPPWTGLRSLRFTGPLASEGIQHLARDCRLKRLEELELTLGNPTAGLFGGVGALLGRLLQAFIGSVTLPGFPGPGWADFGPALEALASAKWVRRLRRLRVTTGDSHGLFAILGERFHGTGDRPADLIPDAAVLALADALKSDKLETLVLPAAVVGTSAREKLTARLGRRVAFQ
jgi:uncharacterized protein (TIGR02996 family)